MALESGTSLGPYQISEQIGAGGMGEVYKAADTRLNRMVAVKVLPAHFADDAEMKQRFDREAKTVAGLNHPHICTLHDIGQAEIETSGETGESETQTVAYLVMEYLEGETLAERLARGPLPLDEALRIGIQVADGLEKAHANGVTHRDLKPGNIMLTPSGAKLLDFGLAKLQQAPQAGADSGVSDALTTTAPGTVLGTMQYMAPEQLEGREADARTDLFAFGAVLYEMITGRKAFEGKSQAHLIAAIVSTEPDPVSSQFTGVPRVLDFLIERCLEKDPEQRLQTATDLLWELRWIAGGGAEGGVPANLLSRPRLLSRVGPFALAGLVLLVVVLATLAFLGPGGAEADMITRFLIDVPDMPAPEAVSISPDGRTVAYSARDGGSTALFVRPMLVDVPQRLEGTDGAGPLFWSPDSRWIAFFANGVLRRIEATGGPPQNIAETTELHGGTWGPDGEILFGSGDGIRRVLAAGGEPSPVAVSLPEDAGIPLDPYFLPDGRHFLFRAGDAIYAASLDDGEATELVSAGSNAVYAEPGFLLFHREGTLYAQPFDANALTPDGEAVRLADGLPVGSTGAAAFAASHTGVLVYRNEADRVADPIAGGGATGNWGAEPPMQWVSRDGRMDPASEPRRWIGVDISPDGGQVAAHRHDPDGGDIWIFRNGELTPERFTFDGSQENSMPVWSPDGRTIAFASERNGQWGLYVKPADRSQDEELVVETERPAIPMSWTPDGRTLVYSMTTAAGAGDVWTVDLDTGPESAAPLLETPADERNPQISPNGRMLAYSSNETGRSEIYIRPFPAGPGRTQVSVDGGVFPRWRNDSRELYFMNLISFGGVMASEISINGTSVDRAVPIRLFQAHFINVAHAGGQHHAYAVSGDGQRFLIPGFSQPQQAFGGVGPTSAAIVPVVIADRQANAGGVPGSGNPITVVLNWPVVPRS